MQKVLRYFLLMVFALCMYVPGMSNMAEAAGIVVLPVINNVDYPDIESTYYDNVIDCVKKQNRYELIDNDEITKIIDKNVEKGILPNQQALQNIAEQTDAELVVVIELNKLKLEPVPRGREDMAQFTMIGKCASYDLTEGKYKVHRFNEDELVDMGYYTRQNFPLRNWARQVQREMHRVMQVKGLNLQKPRMTKF